MSVRSGSNGRGDRGLFAPGNKLASGNPNAKRMHELRSAVLEAVTKDQVEKVINKLGELAAGGDTAAAKVFLDYTIGRPAQAVELSGPDGEPLTGADWPKIQAAILEALAPFSEARVAVALRLRSLNDDGDEG